MRWRTSTMMVLTIGGLAVGQVRSTMHPNVLDASPQVGTGGYNRRISQRYRPGSGNLYITGNVTGGKQFRGMIPYRDSSALRLNLGTSALRSFRRESIGLNRIGREMPYGQAQPYFEPSSTVLSPSALTRGLTGPGTNMPKSGVLSRPPGVLTSPDDEMGELIERARLSLPASIRARDILVPSVYISDERIEGPAADQARERTMALPAHPGPEVEDLGEVAPGPSGPLPEQIAPADKGQAPPAPGDRFKSLKKQAEDEADGMSFGLISGPQAEFAETAKRLIMETQSPTTGPAEDTSQRIGSLAGKSQSAFDQVMRQAEALMADGQYYTGFEVYGSAWRMRPDDALPVLGQVNAMLAAGELRVAGAYLKQALAMFPKLIYLRYDGAQLLGGKEVVEKRLSQVRQLADRDDRVEVQLLQGYGELLGGSRTLAMTCFAKADLVSGPEPGSSDR